ncbi:MAG: four helix bundle protein [Candidatus Staskawiczbacteria bacterium RIFCSPHIGHO2_02_FULL_34_10]|uniref:Four helix bundle protein n=1 Tax=Candidatus Staskawiczbacteria bacterium RIFCSPHIGHO2_02_FULL_34_10 TaxID=1802205 RepID=A0A1G2HZ92_9BACT|nr:MAG: four helix bundle protein [Candidatus Staskawiczbacteria bacterium RIFCSPHIGHO2_02_FULL_34_10]
MKNQNSKRYDLGDRTLEFAKRVVAYVNRLPRTIANIEVGKQLVRSSGSVGANYIEAEESLSRKDFCMRIKISRKEAKESRYWILISEPIAQQQLEKDILVQEGTELTKIFGAIIEKSK